MSIDSLKYKTMAWSGQFDPVNDDIRLIPVMSDSTAPAEVAAEFVGDLTTLDELATAGRKSLSGKSIVQVPVSNEIQLHADDPVWPNMADGPRQVIGFVVCRFVTDDSDSPFLGFLDGPLFPMNPGGQPFTLSFPGDVVWKLGPSN